MRIISNKSIYKKTVILCALYFIAIVFSLYIPALVYVSFFIGIFSAIFLPNDAIFGFLLFTYPYANLVSSEPGGFSLFILIELFTIGIVIIRGGIKTFNKRVFLLLVLLFGITCLTMDSILNIKYFILIVKIILLLYFFVKNYQKCNAKNYYLFFLSGMILSSILGLFKLNIPRLLSFFETDLNYETIGNRVVMRFSGINTDPNHYSIPLMLCISICLFSILSRNAQNLYKKIAIFLLLTLFGIMTLSKSFFLIYVVTFLYAFFVIGQHSKKEIIGLFLIAICIGFVIMPKSIITNLLYRFTNITNTNVSTMNGREIIWSNYINAINETWFVKWFGHGMQAGLLNGRASHNIFLEMMYRCGILGMLTYVSIIISILFSRQFRIKYGISNCWGFIIIIIQYFFLSGFTVYDYAYYLMIAFVMFVNDYRKNESFF